MKKTIYHFIIISSIFWLSQNFIGCANIVPPLGGPRDSLPPVLLKALPAQGSTNYSSKNIVLSFDEFIQVENAFANVVVSPMPEKFPLIEAKLKTITIKMRDTLEPNTTYSINFGNAIKDYNEGNVFKNFSYVFSTGNVVDSFSLGGTVTIAETGNVDSTLIVMLHNKIYDSAVAKEKPRYIAKIDGKGHFKFSNLPAGNFALFALKDEGVKKYSSNKTMFAFADKPIQIGSNNKDVALYAFAGEAEDKDKNNIGESPANTGLSSKTTKEKEDKKLRFQVSVSNGEQDLLKPLKITFSKKIKTFDSSKIFIIDEKNTVQPFTSAGLDSTKKIIQFANNWKEKINYKLILLAGAAADSAGSSIAKNDTIVFKTKTESSYGAVMVQIKNIDLKKHPVLQWVQNDIVVNTIPLTSNEWKTNLFEPGEYSIRILNDANQNGVWDTGNYWKKTQPEIAIPFNQKFTVRANYDNEFTLVL